MKAAIYNPYLDTLGGGERYTIAFANALHKLGYVVDVEWVGPSIKERLEERFGVRLPGINFIKGINRGDGYDICFWVSDGSIPALKARTNFLHFQIPFKDVGGKSLLNKMKLFRIHKVVCNSYLTKKFIDLEYGVESVVLYPPVDIAKLKPKRKENIILFVGRFSQLTQAKRQDVLVAAFKKLYDRGVKDWKLVLAGGAEVGTDEYFDKLKKSIKNYPIEIIVSPPFRTIRELYGNAKLFWSAVGFGVDETREPKKVEHFGISVVESMAAGVVPLVYNAGGHKEIIAHGDVGFLWKTEKELLKLTRSIINDKSLWRKMSKKSVESSKIYEYERFEAEVEVLL